MSHHRAQILAIRREKTPAPQLDHLTGDEVRTLLAGPGTASARAVRDTVLLAVAYDTAARVQELCDLDVADIRRGSPMTVVIHGKGSKIRYVPVVDPTARLVAGYLDHRDRHPRASNRPTAYRIAELLGSLQGEGRPLPGFLRRLTFTVLLGDNDAHAKNLAILHLPGRSTLADVYDSVPNLFQDGRIDYNLALAIDGCFDHRRISATHLIREAQRWNAFGTGEAEQIVTETLADFAKALDQVDVPPGVPSSSAAQLAWNVERLQGGTEIGERSASYRRRRSRPRPS